MLENKYLDFEEEIKGIDKQIKELKKLNSVKVIDYSEEVGKLEKEKDEKLKKIYSELTPWQIVCVARHLKRPLFKDYLEGMIEDFHELHGDRRFGDDCSIITGLGKIGRNKVLVIG